MSWLAALVEASTHATQSRGRLAKRDAIAILRTVLPEEIETLSRSVRGHAAGAGGYAGLHGLAAWRRRAMPNCAR
jgi:hypothetical protein